MWIQRSFSITCHWERSTAQCSNLTLGQFHLKNIVKFPIWILRKNPSFSVPDCSELKYVWLLEKKQKTQRNSPGFSALGGDDGTRTRDLRLDRPACSPLHHAPERTLYYHNPTTNVKPTGHISILESIRSILLDNPNSSINTSLFRIPKWSGCTLICMSGKNNSRRTRQLLSNQGQID